METQALILAAGLGTRLWPLTADRAKPAVPFLGRSLVAWCAELLARHGFQRAVVNTHYQPASVQQALRGAPLEIALSHEPTILGTAGAIAHAVAGGLLDPTRPVLVLNGKLFTDLDLTRALATHRASGAKVTMVLRTNVTRERFREVHVDGGRVTGFGRLEPASAEALLFTGVHVLDPDVVAQIPAGVETDTIKDTYPPLIAARAVAAHVEDRGRWWELSTLARYVELHAAAAREGLGPSVVLGRGARVDPSAKVGRAVLWDDASIGAGADVDEVVVAEGARVEPGETLRRVVVVRADRAGPLERGTRSGDRVLVPLS